MLSWEKTSTLCFTSWRHKDPPHVFQRVFSFTSRELLRIQESWNIDRVHKDSYTFYKDDSNLLNILFDERFLNVFSMSMLQITTKGYKYSNGRRLRIQR